MKRYIHLIKTLIFVLFLTSCASPVSNSSNKITSSITNSNTNTSSSSSRDRIIVSNITDFNIETFDEIIFEIDKLVSENDNIIDIEILDFDFAELDDFVESIDDETKNKYLESGVNLDNFQKIFLATFVYTFTFLIRTATMGPIVATISLVSDIALGLAFDSISYFIGNELGDGENLVERTNTKPLSQTLIDGFFYGAIFDFVAFGLETFFGSIYRSIKYSKNLNSIVKSTGSNKPVVESALNKLRKHSSTVYSPLPQDSKTLASIQNETVNRIGRISEFTDEERLVIKKIIKSDSALLENVLFRGGNDPVLSAYSNYKDSEAHSKLLRSYKNKSSEGYVKLKSIDSKDLKSAILSRRESVLKDLGISNEEILEYISYLSISDFAPSSQVLRAYRNYVNDLKEEYLGSYTYKMIARDPNILKLYYDDPFFLEKIIRISRYDDQISKKFLKEIRKIDSSLKIKNYLGEKSNITLAEIIKKLEDFGNKKNSEILDLGAASINSFEILRLASQNIDRSYYKAEARKLLSDHIVEVYKVDKTSADRISKVSSLKELKNVISQIENPINRDKIEVAFGLRKLNNNEFKQKIFEKYEDQRIVNIFEKNRYNPSELEKALKDLRNDGSDSINSAKLNEAIQNYNTDLAIAETNVDNSIAKFLYDTDLFSDSFESISRNLDAEIAAAVIRENHKNEASNVDLFFDYLNGREVDENFLNSNSMKQIANEYFLSVNRLTLNEIQTNQIRRMLLFSYISLGSDYRRLLLNGRIDDLLNLLTDGGDLETIRNFVNQDDLMRRFYEELMNNDLRYLLEMNNKGILNMSSDFKREILTRRLKSISYSNETQAFAARRLLSNDTIDNLLLGDFDILSFEDWRDIHAVYDYVFFLMKNNESAELSNLFFRRKVRMTGLIAIQDDIKYYQDLIERSLRDDISEEQRNRILDLANRYKESLSNPNRFSRESNEAFIKLLNTENLSYEEGIRKFYVEVTYTFEGIEYKTLFANFDQYALSVTTVPDITTLTGANSDFIKTRSIKGVTFEFRNTTLHHSEDGLNMINIDSQIHRAVQHQGGASRLEKYQDYLDIIRSD
jgi:hypothetical protein